jgi:hypothetical protein
MPQIISSKGSSTNSPTTSRRRTFSARSRAFRPRKRRRLPAASRSTPALAEKAEPTGSYVSPKRRERIDRPAACLCCRAASAARCATSRSVRRASAKARRTSSPVRLISRPAQQNLVTGGINKVLRHEHPQATRRRSCSSRGSTSVLPVSIPARCRTARSCLRRQPVRHPGHRHWRYARAARPAGGEAVVPSETFTGPRWRRLRASVR